MTYESASVGLCLLDRELRFLAINERLAAANGHPAAAHLGRTLSEMAPHVEEVVGPVVRQVLATGQPREDLEVRTVESDAPRGERVWLVTYYPVRDASGQVIAAAGAVLDITARKHAEDTQQLLSREVDHRAKNVLAVVRSLVRLSAADAPDDVDALVEVLEGRIAAMARVHTMLSREGWGGADLREIVTQELEAYAGNVSLQGPPVRLAAEAAQPLTMVLHELATNAAKYGALSSHKGHVAISWRLLPGRAGVTLDWTERGGPAIVGPPARTGFGSRLVDANAAGQLAGGIERHWEAEGLRCVLTLGQETLLREALPLAGRRVLLVVSDLPRGLELARELIQIGCEVAGPATSAASGANLLRAQGRMDAAVIEAAGADDLAALAGMLRSQAAALVVLAQDPAQAPEDAIVLPRDAQGPALRGALDVALARPRVAMAQN